jgi:putative ABC transport system substrate-binding protein
MRRRAFLVLLGSSATWPLMARAQQPTMARIGILIGLPENDPVATKDVQALLEGLSLLGWKRDKNMRIDIRWSADPARMQQVAKDLIELRPDFDSNRFNAHHSGGLERDAHHTGRV